MKKSQYLITLTALSALITSTSQQALAGLEWDNSYINLHINLIQEFEGEYILESKSGDEDPIYLCKEEISLWHDFQEKSLFNSDGLPKRKVYGETVFTNGIPGFPIKQTIAASCYRFLGINNHCYFQDLGDGVNYYGVNIEQDQTNGDIRVETQNVGYYLWTFVQYDSIISQWTLSENGESLSVKTTRKNRGLAYHLGVSVQDENGEWIEQEAGSKTIECTYKRL